MVKRLFAVMCILSLLLCACSKPGAVLENASDTTGNGSETHNGTPVGIETDPIPETESTEYVPIPSEAQSTTSGGYRVQIDTSHYTPYRPPESLYTMPENVDLSEFHPENANGPIYPYTTDELYTSYEGGYGYLVGYHYGFIDSSGTLVTDGIYTSCNSFRILNYETNQSTILPFWLVGRMGDVKMIHSEGEDFSYDYPEGTMLYGLVAKDGSFSIPCEYETITGYEDCIICTRSYANRDYVVYDFNGNLIMTTQRLFDEGCNWNTFNYGEGLYLVGNHYEAKNSEYYFYNKAGERVLGPYISAEVFSEGAACVSTDGTHYGFIDKAGNWLIPPRYDDCSSFRDGRAFARDAAHTLVIDKTGKIILQADRGDFNFFSAEACGFKLNTNGSYREYYDRDGNLLLSGYGDWSCLDETVFYRSQGSNLILHSLDDSIADLTVPGIQYLNKGVAYVDGSLLEGYVYEDYSENRKVFVYPDLSAYRVIEDQVGKINPDNYYYIMSGETVDEVTGEQCYYVFDEGKWRLFNSKKEQIGSSDTADFRLIDGKLMGVRGMCCTYRSLDGELLFSFPYRGDGD